MIDEEQDNPIRVMRASAIGLLLGGFFASVAVLPAEYGIDPTGLGEALGLMKLFDPSASAPGSEGALGETTVPIDGSAGVQRAAHELTLASGEGVEFKVVMEEGAVASFRWIASGVVHFDQHGEPAGDPSGYFESYALGEADSIEGKFTALFTGTHGWYWRNDGADPVTIDLKIAGEFRLKTEP